MSPKNLKDKDINANFLENDNNNINKSFKMKNSEKNYSKIKNNSINLNKNILNKDFKIKNKSNEIKKKNNEVKNNEISHYKKFNIENNLNIKQEMNDINKEFEAINFKINILILIIFLLLIIIFFLY